MPQKEMTTASKFVSLCYMFVGGSPGSTAGGIKTVAVSLPCRYIHSASSVAKKEGYDDIAEILIQIGKIEQCHNRVLL